MNTLLRAGFVSLVVLGATSAGAADMLSSKLPPAPPLPALFSWTGFHAGGQIGYAWGSGKTRFGLAPGPLAGSAFSYAPESAFGGGHLGYSYQFGGIVIGAEADLEAANVHGGFSHPAGRGRIGNDWQGSVRARLGFAFDRFMIYGTGGAAFTEFERNFVDFGTGLAERATNSRTGWTAGGGVAVAVSDNLIAGLEYRYTDYGRFGSFGRYSLAGLGAEQETTFHSIRTSLSYKF